MLTIYGSDLSSPANKVRFTANALGLQYDYKRVNLRAGENKTPEFKKLNPSGKIPAINDDGFNLFESTAICKYLARKAKSDLYPTDLKQCAIVDQWIDFGTMHISANLAKVTYNRLFAPMRGAEVDERSIQDGINFLNAYLPVIDEQLGKNKYLAGNQFTLADINLLALMDPCEASKIDLSPYQNITKWRNELRKQSFYTKCHNSYTDVIEAMMAKK